MPDQPEVKHSYDQLLANAVKQPGVGAVMDIMKAVSSYATVVAHAQYVPSVRTVACSSNGSSQHASRF